MSISQTDSTTSPVSPPLEIHEKPMDSEFATSLGQRPLPEKPVTNSTLNDTQSNWPFERESELKVKARLRFFAKYLLIRTFHNSL
jgi:hypothetical protein